VERVEGLDAAEDAAQPDSAGSSSEPLNPA
jgi:hypothetical protein